MIYWIVIVAAGAVVAVALVVFGGRRVTGRSGGAEEMSAQIEAQMYASRGWERSEGTPAWDGENRLAAPETDVAL